MITMPGADAIEVLVQRVRDGDHDAFDELVAATQYSLRSFTAAHVSSADMLEEVVQATYIVCYERLDSYHGAGVFESWLRGIARNVARSELRRQARLCQVEDDRLEGELVRVRLARLDEDDDDSAVDLRARLAAALKECIAGLPDHSRHLLQLFYDRDLTLATVAARVGKQRGAIAVALSRIRQRLRACLDGKGVRA